MNRILYEKSDCVQNVVIFRTEKARHIREVLRAGVGDCLKIGEIEGPLRVGRVLQVTAGEVRVAVEAGDGPRKPSVDLLLALPRPKVLRRLLPQIAALGVGNLYLTNASRVERPYFDTHVLESETMRDLLLEGLTQAGDTLLPTVRVVRRLKVFLEDELDGCSDAGERLLLHPHGGAPLLQVLQENPAPSERRSLLAVGPEGGWVPFELDLFETAGFRRVGMTHRILRSDTACVAALAAMAMRADAS
ncbi:MAG: 16S rRNA (uracil(1498)-N(3))-methyltransferase [Verrucomicrobia bacterium]|nr:16S rRNA (uracil(1498)-N(3))-methyltransferase [Verrucomicrobiota bacterium]